ncbi:hypothetical protein BDM02DRAFT_3187975 [Thelephora ganbajun]|uniref:Uncharacterized protein n=1 Tax=Thelephora ganbajun TaxID=370292 RepID=A0ACB6ZCX2_THEGA|nr:hypothetical protein BDM02DRAFT_3187975 [Thelephora ganbajun]
MTVRLTARLRDQDLKTLNGDQITVYSGRRLPSKSRGLKVLCLWLIGSGSERHILVNYYLVRTANRYLGLPQTESPHFQQNLPPHIPPCPLYNSDVLETEGSFIQREREGSLGLTRQQVRENPHLQS